MASITINGDTSGSITLTVPATSGTNTITFPAESGTLAPIVSGTSVTASGTAVNFTSIPSWVKRITVMFSAISLNATSLPTVRIGSGSIVATGYSSVGMSASGTAVGVATGYTTGFTYGNNIANFPITASMYGVCVLTNVSGNTWIANGQIGDSATSNMNFTNGGITLGGVLDRLQITTAAGTAAFDAGTFNILYE